MFGRAKSRECWVFISDSRHLFVSDSCQIETTGVIFLLFFSSDNVKDEMMEDKNKDDPSHTQNNGQTEGKVIAFYNKIILLIKA